jgi:hypothetical protein
MKMANYNASGTTIDEQSLPGYIMEGDVPVEFDANEATFAGSDPIAEDAQFSDYLADMRQALGETDSDYLSDVRRALGATDSFPEGDDEALLAASERLIDALSGGDDHSVSDDQSQKSAKKYSMQELMELIAEGKTPEDVRQIDDKYVHSVLICSHCPALAQYVMVSLIPVCAQAAKPRRAGEQGRSAAPSQGLCWPCLCLGRSCT